MIRLCRNTWGTPLASGEGDTSNDVYEQVVRQIIRDEKLQVTTLDTDALGGSVKAIDTKLNYVLGILVLSITLLISTYGALAFFAWRLVDSLLEK